MTDQQLELDKGLVKLTETLAEKVLVLTKKVETLEKRLDALTEPAVNIRATIAGALRDMADDIDDELTLAHPSDPNEDEDDE